MNVKLLSVCWLLLLYLNGTWYFLRGFLLTRREIHLKSSVSDQASCCLSGTAKYKQIIILVIDALRYDFLKYENTTSANELPVYRNNIPIVHHLLSGGHAAIYQFIADPPTSTLQRLKGLTTGSLPTFIDVGSNFASDELLEDNIINQMIVNGLKVSFMGDDTWIGLFPSTFHRSYPFPSFDVWDIDTVDHGVEKHLQSEIRREDWNVIIAHCLGVDHTGHRYGPEHPVMPIKLKQMNSLIETITSLMDPDGLLLVMGDHGMSRSGDHGGDSVDETHAAFFAYSPHWNINFDVHTLRTVSQVDLVPTLAILLGIPIPYSNLGSVILDLIYPDHMVSSKQNDQTSILSYYADALTLNVRQVWRYLLAYNENSPFPEEDFRRLNGQHSRIQELFERMAVDGCLENCNRDVQLLKEFIQLTQLFLNEAKEMCRSIWARFDLASISIGLTIFASALVLHALTFTVAMPTNYASIGIVSVLLSILVQRWTDVLALALNLLPVLGFITQWTRVKYFHLTHLVPIVLAVLYTSNSFVVEEPYVVHHLAQTLIWIPWLLRRNPDGHQWIVRAGLSLTTRLGLTYFRCREEQFPKCEANNLHRSLTSLSTSNWTVLGRLFLALISIGGFHLFCSRFLPGGKATKLLTAITAIYWVLQAASVVLIEVDPDTLALLPKLFYFAFLLVLAYQIRLRFLQKVHEYRENTVELILLMVALSILLAGDGLAPGIILTMTNILLVMQLFFFRPDPELWPLYGVLSLHGFFSTGHHTSFPSVPWETAFVGLSHSSSPSVWANALPVLFVSYSTAFSLLLHGLALPLLISLHGRKSLAEFEEGRMYYLLFHAIRLFGCMGAAAIHRRHLMVWKIFAPRLLYELLFALYVTLGTIASYALVQISM